MSPIDLVYCWCDDADPKWRAKRMATAEKFGMATDSVHNGACRYRGGDMLRYSLRSAERGVPWVRTIFIVLDDDQTIPDWPELKNPKIRFVRHSEIMPAEILPCFASDVIEHHLARIPGLADRFLYSNDDTLFWGSPIPESFFFARDGYPYFRYGMRRKPSANGVEQDYRCRLNAADELLKTRFGLRPGPFSMIGRLPHHNVDAYCRQDMLDCYAEFRAEIESHLAFPFRNPKLISARCMPAMRWRRATDISGARRSTRIVRPPGGVAFCPHGRTPYRSSPEPGAWGCLPSNGLSRCSSASMTDLPRQ